MNEFPIDIYSNSLSAASADIENLENNDPESEKFEKANPELKSPIHKTALGKKMLTLNLEKLEADQKLDQSFGDNQYGS